LLVLSLHTLFLGKNLGNILISFLNVELKI